MKMKKILAAAVAAAIIAPASVLAAGPTLYGKIHTSVDLHDNNGSSSTGTLYDEWSLNTNSSRIGVKGSEDLGNGMKVGYLIEWSVSMDGDSGDLGQRNRAVTLSGDWGTALAGRWDTPFKTLGRKIDMFGDQIGDTRNLSKFDTTDNRANNVLAYVTPNMGGLSATVAYVFDAGTCALPGAACTGDNSDASAWSFNAIYNNGPLLVGLAYSDYDDSGANTVGSDNASVWRLGGSYAMGDFKLAASYTDFESQNFVKNNDPDMWTLGGSYKMGNNTIKLQYSDLDESGSSTKDGADMWSLGLDHAMSKRTTVYAAYATTDNDTNSARTSWNGGHDGEGVAAAGQDADAFSIGLIHKF
jgi:predicted porin